MLSLLDDAFSHALLFNHAQFYNLSADLAGACLKGFSEADIDFPFRVSPTELEIINMRPTRPPTGATQRTKCSACTSCCLLL